MESTQLTADHLSEERMYCMKKTLLRNSFVETEEPPEALSRNWLPAGFLA